MASNTTTSLTITPMTGVFFGQENLATFFVNVQTNPPSSLIPSGTVTLYAGAILLGNITLDANGNGSFTIGANTLQPGNYLITATYNPTNPLVFSASQTTGQFIVNPIPSIVILTVSPNPVCVGNKSSFQALIRNKLNNDPITTGTIVFTIHHLSSACSARSTCTSMIVFSSQPISIDAKGKASLCYRFKLPGMYIVEATFQPQNGTFINASTSNSISVDVLCKSSEGKMKYKMKS